MEIKTKICSSCKKPKVIWKNVLHPDKGKLKLCKDCSYLPENQIDKKKKVNIKPIADKRAKQIEAYRILRDEFMKSHTTCEALLPGCQVSIGLELHHTKGKENELLLDTRYWKVLCHNCHSWITEHSKEAIEMGFSTSRHKIN